MNKKLSVSIVVVILIVFGIVMFYWLSSFKKQPSKRTPPPSNRFVKTDPVSYRSLPGILETSGRLIAFDEIVISSEVSGRLNRGALLFKAGQAFQKGELIVKVINDEFTYQLKAKKSKFLQSIASILPDLKIDFPDSYPDWMDFFESVNIDQPIPKLPETSSSKERIFLASRNVLNDYYSIKSDDARYLKHSIYAPFDGSLKEVSIQVGSVVNPGVRLAIFTRNDLYEIEVPVQVQNIELLNRGMKAEVRNESDHLWTGTISRIGRVINPATQTVSVFVAVKSTPQHPLYDGMYFRVKLFGNNVPNVMEMPRIAVYNGSEVYILSDQKLYKRDIVIRKLNKETLYFNGLEVGEQLVIEAVTGITGNAKFEALKDIKIN